MFKKTITYTDYNEVERTENHYFHLNESEILKMEMGIKGGLAEKIKRIVDADDTPAIIEVFEDLIQKSYGVKTLDGRGFTKKREDLEAFMATEAYSKLFMELATNSEAAAEFINGIIPADLAKKADLPAIAAENN